MYSAPSYIPSLEELKKQLLKSFSIGLHSFPEPQLRMPVLKYTTVYFLKTRLFSYHYNYQSQEINTQNTIILFKLSQFFH